MLILLSNLIKRATQQETKLLACMDGAGMDRYEQTVALLETPLRKVHPPNLL